MQSGLFAKKVGMTQIFDEKGTISPVTILKAGLCKVSQIKTVETDGYNAVQLAYSEEKFENVNKPKQGLLKKLGRVKGLNLLANFVLVHPKNINLVKSST